MGSEHWLKTPLVLPGLDAAGAEPLVHAAASVIAPAAGVELEAVQTAFREALRLEGWSLGGGVAIPHAELAGVKSPLVALVVTRAPVKLPSIDNRPPDVFFFILAPPEDPEAHLLLLARLARLAQSRTLIDGLRKARTPDEAVALVRAGELRHAPARQPSASDFVLILIAIAGEQAADALLVELQGRGFDEATIVEAQSVREATTREVPLFAGFQDIFGDPGGRRVILLDAPASQVDDIMAAVRRIADERRARDVRISVMPLQAHWQLARTPAEEEAGHR